MLDVTTGTDFGFLYAKIARMALDSDRGDPGDIRRRNVYNFRPERSITPDPKTAPHGGIKIRCLTVARARGMAAGPLMRSVDNPILLLAMTEHFYRYRPIKAVLDEFHELENQEIYFSTTDELNDPMEGFKDLFWSGDEIVWRNFLKHYILCVLLTANCCFIGADQFDPNVLRNIVFWVSQELPEAPIREVSIGKDAPCARPIERFGDVVAHPISVARHETDAALTRRH